MKGLENTALVDLLIEWVGRHNRNPEASDGTIDANTDLLASGTLDSVGFVELLLYVEEKTGCRCDLDDTDPEEFSTIAGLCRHVGQPLG